MRRDLRVDLVLGLALSLVTLGGATRPAIAAPPPQAIFEIAIDTDNSDATGCDVMFEDASGVTVESGFERLFRIIVDRGVSTLTVSATEVQNCNVGSFSAPIPIDGGWPVGIDNGSGGADVVEAELPSPLIGNPNFLVRRGVAPAGAAAASPQLRLAVQSRTRPGGADTVRMAGNGGPLLFPGGEFPIPTLSEWGALLLGLLLAAAGLLLIRRRRTPAARAMMLLTIFALGAATLLAAVVLDGDVADWSGVPALANDPVGDAALGDPAADIVAVFVSQGSLFFRIDVRDLEQDPPVAVDDQATTPEDTSISVAVLDNDSDPDVVDTLMVQSVTQGGNGSVVIDAGAQSVTYTPNLGYNGPDSFTYTVRDDIGLTDVGNVDVTVTAVNQAPSFTSAPLTGATENNPYAYAVTTADPDPGDTRTIATAPMTTLPGWLGLTDNGDGTATLSGTPTSADLGDHDVTLRVTDAAGLFADQAFTITVVVDNMAPSFTSAPVTAATEDVPYTYNVTTTDPDAGDTRTIAAAPMTTIPAWLTLTDNGDGTATLTGTPLNGDVGDHSVTLRVTDAGGLFADQAFTITVANSNDPPTFTSTPPTQIGVGQNYTYAVTSDDPDVGDTRAIAAAPMTSIPAWLTLTDNGDGTATLFGMPVLGDVGTHDVTLRVEDAGGLFEDQMFTIEVVGPPDAVDDDPGGAAGFMVGANPASPLDTLGGKSVLDNDTLTGSAFIMTFQNPSSNGGSVNVRADGTIVYNPATDFTGLDTFTYTLENSVGLTDSATVTIQVGTSPLAVDDTLGGGATGNVRRDSSGILNVLGNDTGDLLAIDAFGFDADAMGGIAGGELGVTENGGQVAGLTDMAGAFTGEFLYNPPPGFEGTDHFDYQISNGLGFDIGRVEVAVSDMIWFVDNNAAAAGDGRLTSPFNTLALFDAANALSGAVPDPKAGDCIFLYAGGGNYTGGVSLRGSQILVGQGASGATSLPVVCGVTPPAGSDTLPALGGSRPHIENTSAAGNLAGISLSTGNTVRGLDIGNTPNGYAFAGTGVGALTILEVSLDEGSGANRTGGAASISGGPLGVVNVTLDHVESNTAPADGLDVSGLPSGSQFTVTGTTTVTAPGGDGIDLRTSSGSTFTFTGNTAVTTSASGARGFVVNNAGTVNVGDPMTNNGSTISSTNGPGLDASTSALDLTFQSVTSTSSVTTGINLSGATGTFRGNGGAISGATGNAFNVSGGTVGVTYLGTISNTSNRSVSVVNYGVGTIIFGGSVTDSGTGVLLDNNDQGGVGSLFFRGGVVLNTGANTAFTATNGGVVNVCADDNCSTSGGTPVVNTIGATTPLTKTAVNIANTTIGADGVSFRSVAVNAGATGADTTAIVLTSTGAGPFSITGTGSTAGSGGTIENITDVDAVRFDNTGGPLTLANMIIQDIVAAGDGAAALNTRSGIDAIHGQNVMGGLILNGTTIRRVSDNAVNGGLFADGVSATTWNGLRILNSHLEFSNRFSTSASVGDDVNEGLVRVNGITGTVVVTGSTFNNGAAALDLFTPSGAGTLDMTVQSSAFTDLYKEFGCPGMVPTINVGRRALSVQVEGSHDAVVRIGDPAQANAALGNTFTNGFTASVVVAGQEGGMTPHTGDIDVVISRNTFVVTDHLTGTAACPGGSLLFNFPSGGVSLNPTGGTFEAIVSNNLFDQLLHAAGGLGELTIGANTGGGNSEFIVTGNEFRLPWDAAVQIRSENGTGGSSAMLFDNNTYTSGMVGGPADDVGFSTPSPFQGMLVSVRTNSSLDLTVRNENLPLHDVANSPTPRTMEVEVQSLANVLNLFVQNSSAPFGYGFTRTGGAFNLYRVNPVNVTAVQIMTGNGNTGGGGNPAASPPTVATSGVITPSDTPPTLPMITIPLLADTSSAGPRGSADISSGELNRLLDEAAARWISTGLSGDEIERLGGVSVALADLPEGRLGETFAGAIRLDRDAAGLGWFVDATPNEDSEFASTKQGLAGGIDLLTVLLHEIGHALGRDDEPGPTLMSTTLPVATRRLPERR